MRKAPDYALCEVGAQIIRGCWLGCRITPLRG